MTEIGKPPPPGSNRTPVILVVEDEVLLRMTLVEHLQDCGFLALEAGNAHQALEIIESGVTLDVVLTDVRMPGEMDGFGLAGWLRENRPHLPVFVASGYSGKMDMAQELCSSEQFFVKPYDMDLIVARIRERLHGHRPSST